jgi:hypothetical protein
MLERIVSFAGRAIAVTSDCPAGEKIVDFLFRHISSASDVEPHVTFHLRYNEQLDRPVLYQDNMLLFDGKCEAMLATILLTTSIHQLAKEIHGGLVMHAASLAWQGRGIMLPGATSAGKTTLTTWLCDKGFSYLSDELTYVADRADAMHGFARPLNVKLDAWPILLKALERKFDSSHLLNCGNSVLLSTDAFGPAPVERTAGLDLILFPGYEQDAQFELRHLTKAQTGLKLMECLANGRNLAGHGFPEVTRIARSVPAYQLVYSRFEQLDSCIEELLGRMPGQAGEVSGTDG